MSLWKGSRPLLVGGMCTLLGVATLVHCAKHPSSPAAVVAKNPPAKGAVYAQTLILTDDPSPALARASRDLQTYLSAATGLPFRIEKQATHAIQLLRADAPETPPDLRQRLQGLGPAAYVLHDAGDGKLYIVANGDTGLAYGIYQYLEGLGFRFYFPSERWTIIPRLDSIEMKLDRLARPAFRLRQFNGTGGLGRGLVVDPHGELQSRWQAWKARNGFGEEMHIDGHSGEDFNVRNKQVLLDHPDYLANVGGHRVAWSKIVKLDPSNPQAVDLYVHDRIEMYRQKLQRAPHNAPPFAVSVEPADGGGHCDSPECERMGSVSDREFLVANAVAQALQKDFPGAKASLFAYNFHADIPKVAIDPNVYVTIVPYAFQREGADPAQYIKAWAQKKSPLSIYDYWSIPDWTYDQPSFDYRTTPRDRLRFWHQNQVEGFLAESTFSAGAMGLGLYLVGHLTWNLDADTGALTNQFFQDCFGSAAPPMRRMLERWANGYVNSSLELRSSFTDLSEAFRRAKDPATRARLVDYAGYVQYLRLRADWQAARPDAKSEKVRALVLHLWRTYSSGMLDAFRLQQLLLRKNAALREELDPTHADSPVWRSLEPVTEAVALGWIQSALVDLPKLSLTPRRFEGALKAVTNVATSPVAAPAPLTLVGTTQLSLHLASDGVASRLQAHADAAAVVSLKNSAGSVVGEERLTRGADLSSGKFASLPAGDYTLEVRTGKTTHVTLTFSEGMGIELSEFRIPKAVPVPPLYFYLPSGESAVAVYDPIALPAGSGVVVVAPDGTDVPLQRYDGGRLLIAKARPDQTGKIWSLKHAVAPDGTLKLLNAPQRLALDPASLHVPAEALEPQSPSSFDE